MLMSKKDSETGIELRRLNVAEVPIADMLSLGDDRSAYRYPVPSLVE